MGRIHVSHVKALFSIERIRNSLTTLKTNLVFPTRLDRHPPSTDDHKETVSISPVSLSDFTKLLPLCEHKSNKLLGWFTGLVAVVMPRWGEDNGGHRWPRGSHWKGCREESLFSIPVTEELLKGFMSMRLSHFYQVTG